MTATGETSGERAVEALARAWGIEPEYVDNWGTVHQTSRATKRALLAAMGVAVPEKRKLEVSAAGANQSGWGPLCKQNLIVSVNALPERITLRLPKDVNSTASASLTLRLEGENGSGRTFTHPLGELRRLEPEDGLQDTVGWWEVPFPRIDEIGYYALHLRLLGAGNALSQRVFVAVCPDEAYLPPDLRGEGRMAGISLSLYGVRSRRNWGVGDFTDLKAIVDWAARKLCANVIGLNPLHAGYNRSPYNTSPYLPISKFYHNYIYLDVETVEEYRQSPAARKLVASEEVQDEISRLRSSEKVAYEGAAALKRKVLWIGFQDFLHTPDTIRWEAFRDYVDREGDALDRFALFCALDDAMHEEDPNVWTWRQWPAAYRHPGTEAVAQFREGHQKAILFHKYLQWQVYEQLSDVQADALKRGMSIGLYHDLALAIDNCGADAWGYPECFYPGLRVGAPPDAFAQHGQDWGFSPPNMESIARDGYNFFIQEIRKNCRFGRALRIDHVMRLFHLYCMPEGKSPKEGAYISQPYEALLRILLLESVRNRVIIIGEDLGTVPEYIRHTLSDANVLSYRLLYFEKDENQEFIPPGDYPDVALVTVSTHDLPTLAGFWGGRDIALRDELGMFNGPEAVVRAQEERLTDKRRLVQLARVSGMACPDEAAQLGDEITGDCHNALVGLLAVTPSKLFVLSQEDLFKDGRQQNVPGTISEYPNWSIKMKYRLEELDSNPRAVDYARMFRAWVESSGRGGRNDPSRS